MFGRAHEFVHNFIEDALSADANVHQPDEIERLVRRCVLMAADRGITLADIEAEFPNLTEHFRFVIDLKNTA